MLETEHKLHILTPLLWPSRCVFLVLLILGSTPSGLPRTPRSGVAFPTTSGLYCLEVCWQLLWDPNSTELYNNSTPTRSPTGSLKSNVLSSSRGNNCHAVQRLLSSGASLQWHNGTFTLSHIISLNPPTRSLSITGHWNVSLPSGVSPWNSIFGPGRRSKYNTWRLGECGVTLHCHCHCVLVHSSPE